MPYRLEDWHDKITALARIYQSESDVAARHLRNHRHFIVDRNHPIRFVSAHAVKLGLRGEDMRYRKGKTQNIREISNSIARHGYRQVTGGDPEFDMIWADYGALCTRHGVAPSGANARPPKNRSFIFTGVYRPQTLVPLANKQDEQMIATFQEGVTTALRDSAKTRQRRLASAPPKPVKIMRQVVGYLRNRDVIAERLFRADGICEGCGATTPFISRRSGQPFLEVHHKTPLSEEGDDTVENTIALCPNCHRKAHHG
ncbi:MAG: HNH endonuclease [Sulfitobacter sp.]